MGRRHQVIYPTERELIQAVLLFDRMYLRANLNDEELSRIYQVPEYLFLRRAESLYTGRGMRRVNTSRHQEGLYDLGIGRCLQNYLDEVSATVSERIRTLRGADRWDFEYLSPFMREYQEQQRNLLISNISFDIEHFNTVFVYTNDQLRFLFYLAAQNLIPQEIAALLVDREVIVNPWIWQERRVILNDERLAVIAAG